MIFVLQKCCLCETRGGAMKKVARCEGKWAHILCAITIPEAYFIQTPERKRINISKIPTKRRKLVSTK